jgi:hypothetical protein
MLEPHRVWQEDVQTWTSEMKSLKSVSPEKLGFSIIACLRIQSMHDTSNYQAIGVPAEIKGRSLGGVSAKPGA